MAQRAAGGPQAGGAPLGGARAAVPQGVGQAAGQVQHARHWLGHCAQHTLAHAFYQALRRGGGGVDTDNVNVKTSTLLSMPFIRP